MIIVRAPFRISFAGGGSDLPSYYLNNDYGAVVSTTINKYVYITIHKYFSDKFRLRYSITEDVDNIDELKHDIARECLRKYKYKDNLAGYEIASISDIKAGSGLGSSSAYTVALLKALHYYSGDFLKPYDYAKTACEIEIDILGKPIGKQDQYASAYGGINFIEFTREETTVTRIDMDYAKLQRNLLMFHLGGYRDANKILEDQNKNNDKNSLLIKELVVLANYARNCLQNNNIDELGYILDSGWQIKKQLSNKISNMYIDSLYNRGRMLGATGCKLLGAGGNGFLLFYCKPEYQERLRKNIGLKELNFNLENKGVTVVYNDEY